MWNTPNRNSVEALASLGSHSSGSCLTPATTRTSDVPIGSADGLTKGLGLRTTGITPCRGPQVK